MVVDLRIVRERAMRKKIKRAKEGKDPETKGVDANVRGERSRRRNPLRIWIWI